MTDLLLDQLMRVARETAMETAAAGEMLHQYLVMQTPKGLTVNVIMLEAEQPISEAVKLSIFVEGATHAAFAMEAWVAHMDGTDAKFAAMREGRLQPKDLPAAERRDALWIFGETREGAIAEERYLIHPPATKGGPRTFEPEDTTGWVAERDAFRPMFLPRDEIGALLRRLEPHHHRSRN